MLYSYKLCGNERSRTSGNQSKKIQISSPKKMKKKFQKVLLNIQLADIYIANYNQTFFSESNQIMFDSFKLLNNKMLKKDEYF